MHPSRTLESIYTEHGRSIPRMVGTLLNLDVDLEDVELLRRMPWQFPANRIAVERERLDLPAVHPLFHWKLPPPPPAWLTPAVILKMFDLALSVGDAEDVGQAEEGNGLVLPA